MYTPLRDPCDHFMRHELSQRIASLKFIQTKPRLLSSHFRQIWDIICLSMLWLVSSWYMKIDLSRCIISLNLDWNKHWLFPVSSAQLALNNVHSSVQTKNSSRYICYLLENQYTIFEVMYMRHSVLGHILALPTIFSFFTCLRSICWELVRILCEMSRWDW